MTAVHPQPTDALTATELVNQVSGPVYLPGDDGFDAEVAAWNIAAVHH